MVTPFANRFHGPSIGRLTELAVTLWNPADGPAPASVRIETESQIEMKQKSEIDELTVGDRVRLVTESLAWRAEMTLRGKVGEVTERRDANRITVRFDNGRLLMGRDAVSFERVGSGLKAK
jgi:hypothetical protein